MSIVSRDKSIICIYVYICELGLEYVYIFLRIEVLVFATYFNNIFSFEIRVSQKRRIGIVI